MFQALLLPPLSLSTASQGQNINMNLQGRVFDGGATLKEQLPNVID